MTRSSIDTESRSTWANTLLGAVRAAFGVVWTVDAYLTWQPDFASHFVGYLQNAALAQPDWLHPWFALWIGLVTPAADAFIWLTRITETMIALGLLLGLACRWTYLVGLVFSILIWATADGFGGPYVSEAGNPGPALVYVLVFAALIGFSILQGTSPYSVDYYLERRWVHWGRMAAWGLRRTPEDATRPLPWYEQIAAGIGMVIALAVLLSTLQSALNVPTATPANAEAAVSPLSLASTEPASTARDATLPPLLGTGSNVDLAIFSTDETVEIASGVSYQAWTFGGTVPGPIFHVRQGQTVNVTYTNRGMMQHSIDFHAAEVPPNVAYRQVDPGQSIQFSFVARTPGIFIYHCGSPPVLFHMGNGMFGAVVVDPAEPLPPADVSYVLIQSEWYTRQVQGNVLAADYNKILAATPDEVVFNGSAFQYRDHPLPARAGQRVRLYVVDAGPSLASAFHVIGGIFASVYPDGDASHAQTGVSTYEIAPGAGVVFDLVIPEAGQYPFVDHSMRSMQIGAMGMLEVS